MKLSYIVPVYNVEAYLDKCLRSLYNQSLELADFEVVIINDGSSDSSIEIMGLTMLKVIIFYVLILMIF